MRGSSAATQARSSATGRFVKRQEEQVIPGFSTHFMPLARPRYRPSRLSNVVRLVSHHRWSILGYTAYLVAIGVMAALSAFFGAKYGLK